MNHMPMPESAVMATCIDCNAPLDSKHISAILTAVKVRLIVGDYVVPLDRKHFCCGACFEQRELNEGATG